MSKKLLTPSESIDAMKELLEIESDSAFGKELDLTRQDIYQLRKSVKIDPKTKIINKLLTMVQNGL